MQKILPMSSWGYGWPTRTRPIRFIVNHVAVGNGSLYGWFVQSGLSTNYWVSKTGVIEQYVPDTGAAYGQGIVSAGSDFPPEYPGSGLAYNQMALSIEREGYPSEEATAPQWAAIIDLNKWLAYKHGVPVDNDHIVGHYRSDHISRAHCPSTPSLDAPAYMAKILRDMHA